MLTKKHWKLGNKYNQYAKKNIFNQQLRDFML